MKLIIAELELDHIELPRAPRPPARLTGQAVPYAATTISDLFRPIIYFQALDVAIQELQERFTDNGLYPEDLQGNGRLAAVWCCRCMRSRTTVSLQ